MTTADRDWHRDGRLHFALGIEDTFVPQTSPGERAIDEYALTEHYDQWRDDLDRARFAGAELLRWGVPWHRIQPEAGRFAWGWLDRVMERFAEIGLRPIVDLLHYGTPLWLEDQFANPDYPDRVAEYSVAVAERYAPLGVTDYTPVNEPMIHALFAGEYAYWPPYLSGERGLSQIVRQLARGFVQAQQGMASVLPGGGTFVHVDAGMRFVGDVDAPEHRETAARMSEQVFLVEDLVTGKVDHEHPLHAFLTRTGWSDTDLSWFRDNTVQPTVMGVNYYPRVSTEVFESGIVHAGGFRDPRPARDDGLVGLEELLRTASARFGAPVMLTETSVTASVAERAEWMRDSVAHIQTLRADGVDVVGYTWWPVFDMYEWTYRHATGPRSDHLLPMGLWSLVESAEGLSRKPTPLVGLFRSLAEGSSATADRAMSRLGIG
ncbi:family 1 glycosylhydrolase [Microbacterium indicum]|uniref:family 1 glycosylhydrolase n=1 Tax=Microbacterium indicum TaxID=358100 RepID=UPI0003F8900D|nr:family 1 glycosylhydrolase [Microbacterium indicum]